MLTGIHFLLTYKCVLECDHCFLYSGPHAEGTFTLPQIDSVLGEAAKIGTVQWIYFEGGEPSLFYPSMVEGIRRSRDAGFEVGIVTNAYWAISEEDAEVWLRPLAELGIADVSISDDAFHFGDGEDSPARRALATARRLGIPTSPICIEKPYAEAAPGANQDRGAPVVGGGALFKGRAAETLTAALPLRPCAGFNTCPHEELESPARVHVDAYGHVQMCQGVSMGNMWETPLSTIVRDYDARSHPICGPLVAGGPAQLARQYDVDHEEEYVDECHFCFIVRRTLVDRFPGVLAPRQVYGLDPE